MSRSGAASCNLRARYIPSATLFQRYVGVDYSGAATPETRLDGLQVYMARNNGQCTRILGPGGGRWNRRNLAEWLAALLAEEDATVVGIDHAFSFPLQYLEERGLFGWDAFLDYFVHAWPTHLTGATVDGLRRQRISEGASTTLRLCEAWTSSAKSVFLFDVQGSVAKSTHAGLPWLHWLRRHAHSGSGGPIHFWPFDGWSPSPGRSMVVEAYPTLYRRRYTSTERHSDRRDAWSIAMWLRDMDWRGTLERYLMPPLTPAELALAVREGWIIGVG